MKPLYWVERLHLEGVGPFQEEVFVLFFLPQVKSCDLLDGEFWDSQPTLTEQVYYASTVELILEV